MGQYKSKLQLELEKRQDTMEQSTSNPHTLYCYFVRVRQNDTLVGNVWSESYEPGISYSEVKLKTVEQYPFHTPDDIVVVPQNRTWESFMREQGRPFQGD